MPALNQRTLPLLLALLLSTACTTAERREQVRLPRGTILQVRVEREIDTKTTPVGSSFNGRLTEELVSGGRTIAPIGTEVSGRVLNARRAEREGTAPYLTLQVESLTVPGVGRQTVRTEPFTLEGWALKNPPGQNQVAGGGPMRADQAQHTVVPKESVLEFRLAEDTPLPVSNTADRAGQ